MTPQKPPPPTINIQQIYQQVKGKWKSLYPIYFNSTKTLSQGRRVPISLAVKDPTPQELSRACCLCKINHIIEPYKSYPRDFLQKGRVKAQLFDKQGKPMNISITSSITIFIYNRKSISHTYRTKTPINSINQQIKMNSTYFLHHVRYILIYFILMLCIIIFLLLSLQYFQKQPTLFLSDTKNDQQNQLLSHFKFIHQFPKKSTSLHLTQFAKYLSSHPSHLHHHQPPLHIPHLHINTVYYPLINIIIQPKNKPRFHMLKDHKPLSNQSQYSYHNHQMLNLKKQLNRALAQNKKLYQQIIVLDPNFKFSLYQPSKHQGIAQLYLKPLIVRQIDKLMQQSEQLAKKKQCLYFQKNDNKQIQQNLLELTDINHYSFLRKTWLKYQSNQDTSIEKIDHLNKIINIIKNGIKKLQDIEQQNINKQIQNQSYHKTLIQQKQFQQLQRYKMKVQQLQTKYYLLQQILQQKNKKIQLLQSQINLTSHTSHRSKYTFKTQSSLDHHQYKKQIIFTTLTSDYFKITIQSNKISQSLFQQTTKSLPQILKFLRSKIQTTPIKLIPSINTIQSFNLNYSNEQKTTPLITDRFISHPTKFISMKPQSSSLMKQHTLKQSTNLSNNSTDLHHSPQLFAIELPDSNKKFSRKFIHSLTSDRPRKQSKNKFQQNKLDKIITQKLQAN